MNTQFLTKISTGILPVSTFWHNCCNIFFETRDLYSPHASEFRIRCHSRGVTICSLFRDMTNPHHLDSGQRRNVLCYCHWTTCRSYCSFCWCVWCHSVCGSVKQGKGQGFEIRTPVPSFFTRIFHGYICLEVVTLNTKLTIKTLLKNEEFLLEEIRVFVPQYASLRKY